MPLLGLQGAILDAFNAQSAMEMIIFRTVFSPLPAVDGHLESSSRLYLLRQILPIVPLINQLTQERKEQ